MSEEKLDFIISELADILADIKDRTSPAYGDESKLKENFDFIMAELADIKDRLGPVIASESEIRGKYGNPKVNFDPHNWGGESCKGKLASLCPSLFCEQYAESLEWMAKHPKPGQDPKFIAYNKRDAKLFRRWAIANQKEDALDRAKAMVEKTFGDGDLPF